MCVYIYIYIYAYTYMYIYTYLYICIHMYTCVYLFKTAYLLNNDIHGCVVYLSRYSSSSNDTSTRASYAHVALSRLLLVTLSYNIKYCAYVQTMILFIVFNINILLVYLLNNNDHYCVYVFCPRGTPPPQGREGDR